MILPIVTINGVVTDYKIRDIEDETKAELVFTIESTYPIFGEDKINRYECKAFGSNAMNLFTTVKDCGKQKIVATVQGILVQERWIDKGTQLSRVRIYLEA